MRKTLTAAAVLVLMTAPAFAQSFDPDNGTGNILPMVGAYPGGTGAYAQAPEVYGSVHSRAHGYRTMHRHAYRSGQTPTVIPNEDSND